MLKEESEEPYPEYITTGAIAGCCGVSRVTVLRWIGKGHLAAFRLPEGHYRIHRDDFSKFLVKHVIPVRKQMFKKRHGGQAND
ncbi:helix-turn-helix domain-containing protein [Chloroflexota bacterium]